MTITIKEQVESLLKKLKINPHELPIDVDDIAEKLGAQVVYSPMEDNNCGMIFREQENYIIGVNSLHPRNRQRFTLAHEIAHLWLHKENIDENVHVDKAFSEKLFRDKRSSQGDDILEIQANRFASELLVPTIALNKKTEGARIDIDDDGLIKELAKDFEVSFQSMSIRISRMLFT